MLSLEAANLSKLLIPFIVVVLGVACTYKRNFWEAPVYAITIFYIFLLVHTIVGFGDYLETTHGFSAFMFIVIFSLLIRLGIEFVGKKIAVVLLIATIIVLIPLSINVAQDTFVTFEEVMDDMLDEDETIVSIGISDYTDGVRDEKVVTIEDKETINHIFETSANMKLKKHSNVFPHDYWIDVETNKGDTHNRERYRFRLDANFINEYLILDDNKFKQTIDSLDLKWEKVE
ncbi:hypothetical protein [Tenuibacillus multivorans]|uniref:Uncharacterized protein n=1 Tax=Tenuibacillus multivorans TaxID=237069 RepID=A0A1H0AUN1_9BACI|nr:hypothetical protein [Tenuibacillus multivorans]GEL77814.1 hypothetical protein TMU01_20490 [Tenuibacillus multivorans]SDN37055.1 hypothetical protein SAMN05216498_2080 [Tenuibacillus multivorans]